MRGFVLVCVVACSGGTDPIVTTPQPAAAPTAPAAPCVGPAAACALGAHACSDKPTGEWRYAVAGGLYEPVENITRADLVAAWRAGKLAATVDTQAALAPQLGTFAGTTLQAGDHPDRWVVVPADELDPAFKVITVDGKHPIASDALAVPLCGPPVHNIDPAHVTTLVMSGTTALVRRVAERVEKNGADDTVRYVRGWFTSASLVHVSNEVSFVRHCDPKTGPTELSFCTRESDIELLEDLHANIVELTGSHLSDYGSSWIDHTVDMYAQRGWVWFGGGKTQIEAAAPRLVEDHGNRLAFLGCNAVGTWLHMVSTRSTVAACDWARMTWQVRDLRRRGYVPIVSIQHQEVLDHDPPPGLVRDLRRFAAAGAAFVMGSQAHSAHPWDVHYGAYVHYGPGNIFFQQGLEELREAAADKLYIHAGKLLAVEHLYTRLEHGQPRLQTAAERTRFLGQMQRALAKLPPADPWHAPVLPDDSRTRPDSVVVDGKLQKLVVTVPAELVEGERYPLVLDCVGISHVADAFVVTPVGKRRANAVQIADYMRAKYPIDVERTTVVPPLKRKHHHHD